MNEVCAKSKHNTNTIYGCYISLHQREHLKGPNLFKELDIKRELKQEIHEWFKIPIRSLKTKGDCCYHIE